jgi:hypothetical protein
MPKISIGSAVLTLLNSNKGGAYSPQGFGEKEAICGERCPYSDEPKCGLNGCSFYRDEVKKIKKK